MRLDEGFEVPLESDGRKDDDATKDF